MFRERESRTVGGVLRGLNLKRKEEEERKQSILSA